MLDKDTIEKLKKLVSSIEDVKDFLNVDKMDFEKISEFVKFYNENEGIIKGMYDCANIDSNNIEKIIKVGNYFKQNEEIINKFHDLEQVIGIKNEKPSDSPVNLINEPEDNNEEVISEIPNVTFDQLDQFEVASAETDITVEPYIPEPVEEIKEETNIPNIDSEEYHADTTPEEVYKVDTISEVEPVQEVVPVTEVEPVVEEIIQSEPLVQNESPVNSNKHKVVNTEKLAQMADLKLKVITGFYLLRIIDKNESFKKVMLDMANFRVNHSGKDYKILRSELEAIDQEIINFGDNIDVLDKKVLYRSLASLTRIANKAQ